MAHSSQNGSQHSQKMGLHNTKKWVSAPSKMSLNGCKIKVVLNTPSCVSGVSTTPPQKNGGVETHCGSVETHFRHVRPKNKCSDPLKKKSLHLEFQEEAQQSCFKRKKSTCTACTKKKNQLSTCMLGCFTHSRTVSCVMWRCPQHNRTTTMLMAHLVIMSWC